MWVSRLVKSQGMHCRRFLFVLLLFSYSNLKCTIVFKKSSGHLAFCNKQDYVVEDGGWPY